MKKLFSQRFISSVFVLSCIILFSHAISSHATQELYVKNENLNKYPTEINNSTKSLTITIGDLHGNAQKLLYFLIRNNVVRMSQNDFNLFVNIYKKPPSTLSSNDVRQFHAILANATINPKHKLKFLGDDLCDRGMNDYYTLNIFKKLDEANVPFDIVLSNHGSFFLKAYENAEQSFSMNPYGPGRNEPIVKSMLNLGSVIKNGLVNQDFVVNIIEKNYLKHLVFPGVFVDDANNEITLYSHAPIDLKILSDLAKAFEIEFDDSNLTTLRSSLNKINQKIKSLLAQKRFTETYKSFDTQYQSKNSTSPLRQILWNRDYEILAREYKPEGKNYKINYVHGHDSASNVINLDNLFGKGDDNDIGSYAIHVTY